MSEEKSGASDPKKMLASLFLKSDLFGSFAEEDRLTIADACIIRRVEAGETIYRRGDPASELALIVTGVAQAVLQPHDATATLLAEFGPAATYGEAAFLGGATRSTSLRARTDVSLAELTRAAYARLESANPTLTLKLSRNIAKLLARRVGDAHDALARALS